MVAIQADTVALAAPRPDQGIPSVTGEPPWDCATVMIQNQLGMHARPAMAFVDIANRFAAEVRVARGTQEVDGKSIMQMMMLAATCGTELCIKARGEDAQPALEALKGLIDRKFDEE